jgi:polysaccharide pyruvyl transferase WcaK-like protein
MQVNNILVIGNYGAGNIGDDLLMEACVKGLRSVFYDAVIVTMGPRADAPLPPAGIMSTIKLNWFKARKAMKQADLVVFGGGGLFNPEVPYSMFVWGRALKMANSLKKPVVMLGQSFPDYNLGSLVGVLDRSEFVTVRDSISEKVLAKLNSDTPVKRTADLVFGLDFDTEYEFASEFDEYVCVNLRSYKGLSDDHVLNVACGVLDKLLKETSLGVYLVPFAREDAKILRRLCKIYEDTGRFRVLDFDMNLALAALKNSNGIISERLHPLIVGAIMRKPIYALAYNTKVEGFMADMALPEYCYDLKSEHEPIFDGFSEDMIADDKMLQETKAKTKSNYELLKVLVDDLVAS